MPGELGELAEGELCATDQECASHRCAPVDGQMRCGRQCDSAEGCGDLACELDEDSCGTCLPFELSSSPRPLGAGCDDASECASGQCLAEGAGEGYCTDVCGSCPDGFHCRESLCRRGELAAPGDGCVTSEDCGADAQCIEVDGDRLCALPCGDGCDSGFECAQTSASMRCLPVGIPLGEPCMDHDECRTGVCAGVCTRICEDTPCPESYECRLAGPVSGCFAPDSEGGCSASRTDDPGSLMLVMLLLLLLFTRRPSKR